MNKQSKIITGRNRTLTNVGNNYYTLDNVSARRAKHTKMITGIFMVIVLVGMYSVFSETGVLDIMMNGEMLQERIGQLGFWGPLMIISLIAVAIVFSPLPSAPIALAAGAVYGHTYGMVYVLAGSMIGAIVAFSIARVLGYEIVHKLIDKKFSVKLPGGQNTLTGLVFVSRLIPFISFDSISYIAGLTSLTFWRFTAATFAGIVPASFLLAHFGSEIAATEAGQSMVTIILLSGITLIPLAFAGIKILRNRNCF